MGPQCCGTLSANTIVTVNESRLELEQACAVSWGMQDGALSKERCFSKVKLAMRGPNTVTPWLDMLFDCTCPLAPAPIQRLQSTM